VKYTFSDLQTAFLQRSGNAGSIDTTLLDFFKRSLAARYQMAFSEVTNRQTYITKTASTVANQQYYHFPPGMVNLEGATVEIGGVNYPVITDDSQLQWDLTNTVLLSVQALPRFIFPRRDDFGIWPIPQSVYTITITYPQRDRSLGVVDYTTGTVAVTQNSQTVTGSGGATFTSAMIGRWFVMDDTSKQGEGYWYRISAVPTSSTLTLETSYEGVSASGATYRIGEVPELPEELHSILVDGVLADYYSGPRSDIQKATWFNNVFWTGDGNNSTRDGKKYTGGMLGAIQRYAGRANGAIVWKHGITSSNWLDRMWASSASSS